MQIILKPGAVLVLVGVVIALSVGAFWRLGGQTAKVPDTAAATASVENLPNAQSIVEPTMSGLSDAMKKAATSDAYEPVEKPGGNTQATCFTIIKPGKVSWEVSTGAAATRPVKQGSELCFSVWARSATQNEVELVLERNGEPFDRYLSESVTLTPEWKEYGYLCTVTNDFPERAGVAARVHMASTAGVVELAGLKVVPAL
ncbi:MAG: hypothetical protein H8F28_11040 [Fibrella sp.]|nr:hypothetical protein [Armatimonadota bacterium]